MLFVSTLYLDQGFGCDHGVYDKVLYQGQYCQKKQRYDAIDQVAQFWINEEIIEADMIKYPFDEFKIVKERITFEFVLYFVRQQSCQDNS